MGVGSGHRARRRNASGITAGMLIQPVAGAASDALLARFMRIAHIAVAVLLTVVVLGGLAVASTIPLFVAAYVAVQLALNAAQAPYQALLPDLVPARTRGKACGMKGDELARRAVGIRRHRIVPRIKRPDFRGCCDRRGPRRVGYGPASGEHA